MIWIFVQYHWGLLIVEGKGLTGLCEWPISELTEGQFNGIILYVVPRRWNNAMPLELTEIQTNCIFTLICFSNILVYWLICYLFIILFSYLPTYLPTYMYSRLCNRLFTRPTEQSKWMLVLSSWVHLSSFRSVDYIPLCRNGRCSLNDGQGHTEWCFGVVSEVE